MPCTASRTAIRPSRSRALPLLAAALAFAACSRPGGASSTPGASTPPAVKAGASAAASGADVVAEVNGAPILASELEQKAARRLARLRQEEYELRRQALDELIAERLVAAEAGRRGYLAGIQELAGNATALFYATDEAQEGRDAFLERRHPDFGKFPRRP